MKWWMVALLLALGAAVLGFRARDKVAEAPICDMGACPEARCGPGVRPQVGADGCCPVCPPEARQPFHRGQCVDVACDECPDGTKPHEVPGQCCPRCVAVDDEACSKGRSQYEARWAQLELELQGCQSDDDCTYASFSDACRASCPLPLNKHRLGDILPRLREEASAYCELCYPASFECPPLDSKRVACVSGRCEFEERKR